MREIVLVNKLIFEFRGSIAKRALVVGDADNDQRNELVCANLQGDLAVFKDKNPQPYAHASDLGMVTACLIGDVINSGKNYVTAINTEGWLFIFELLSPDSPSEPSSPSILIDPDRLDPTQLDTDIDLNDDPKKPTPIALTLLYTQRVPANCKELLIADLDGDGQYEIIIGLTDRVLRTYRWVQIGQDRGKFVGLYKWEFADQIGSVSLNTSRHDGCQDIIVAQPGGTYAKLECFDKNSIQQVGKLCDNADMSTEAEVDDSVEHVDSGINQLNDEPIDDKTTDEVKTEYISKLTPEYHQLSLSQMRNHHVSTEVLGGVRVSKESDSYSLIVLATLDGTLMLASKDEILWSLQVDHQLFALAMLETRPHRQSLLSQSESTCTIVPNVNIDRTRFAQSCFRKQQLANSYRKVQYIVACAWDGKTYIVDEDRNYLRFKFDEAVSAFAAGNYYFDGRHHPSLLYATFNNQVILYNDVIMDNIRPMYLMDELIKNPEYSEFCNKLEKFAGHLGMFQDMSGANSDHDIDDDAYDVINNCEQQKISIQSPSSCESVSKSNVLRRKVLQKLIDEILYSVSDDELMEIANRNSASTSANNNNKK